MDKKHWKWSNDADCDVDLENLGASIEAEVNEHIERLANELESKFGPEFSERIAEKVARGARKVADHAERTAAKTRYRNKSSQWGGDFSWTAATESRKRSESVEERLNILKMVESGSITPDEAALLLDALDG